MNGCDSSKIIVEERAPKARPFLRWAGGKQRLAPALLNLTPKDDSYNKYYEPFLGGGSLFFRLNPKSAILNDINSELINCYEQVKENIEIVIKKLDRYADLDSRSFYYRIRNRSTKSMSKTGRAARFIYLNKAAFNGIYRVNLSGKFNVPYGPSRTGLAIPSKLKLREVSKKLSCANFGIGDFEDILAEVKANDFVYLDPPYPPASATSFFNHYDKNRFSWDDQVRVSVVFKNLADLGCKVMLSNSSHNEIINLYKEYNTYKLKTTRWIGSNGDRYKVHEIVVTNYDSDFSRGQDV